MQNQRTLPQLRVEFTPPVLFIPVEARTALRSKSFRRDYIDISQEEAHALSEPEDFQRLNCLGCLAYRSIKEHD